MNQQKLVGATLASAAIVGLILAGWAAGLLGLWISGWQGDGLPAVVDALARGLTLALLAGLFAWLRRAVGDLGGRVDAFAQDMGRRFDEVGREQAFQRERLARLEGVLEGLAAARRDQAGN